MKRLFLQFSTITLLIVCFGINPLHAEKLANETTIINLKVDDEHTSLGIDSKTPRFSWQMLSSVVGQHQTAYQVSISSSPTFDEIIWDSGRQVNGKSLGIKYEGDQLTPSTQYYWKVTVWDKDDQAIVSDISWFETALFGKSGWNLSQWISMPQTQPTTVGDDFNYTVEGVFTCQNEGVGLLFNVQNDLNFYMWQINSNSAKSGRVLIRPHALKDGRWNTYNEQYAVDITDFVGGCDAIKSNPFNLKVEVSKSEIKTYVNNNFIHSIPINTTVGISPFLGKIGVRTNGGEEGAVKSLKMTNYTTNKDGDIVYDYTFLYSNPLFKCKIENGFLVVNKDNIIYSPQAAPLFQKTFVPTSGKTIESARLYATALGVFDLYINGKRVGYKQENKEYIYDELKPGFTQVGKWSEGAAVLNTEVHYHTYDVTELINAGANTLSMLVTSGWWTGAVGGSPGSKTAVRAQLLIKYDDGSVETVGTDNSWKVSDETPVLMADIWHGEAYDATISPKWGKDSNDAVLWKEVIENKEFDGEINSAPEGARVCVRQDLELQPKSVTIYDGINSTTSEQYGSIRVKNIYTKAETFILNPGEKAIIDLGQNFAGWLQVRAKGERGTILNMRHGEMLNDMNGMKSRGNDGPEGTLFTANLHGASATAVYTMSGNGIETYHPLYTFFGFRYVELSTSKPVEIHDTRGIVVTSVKEENGVLSTSNQDVNKLISNIKWGQYSNFLSIPTDCPQRAERQGWTADTHVFSTTAAYLSDSKGFLSKWIQDLRNAQWPDGNYPEVAPRGCFRNAGGAGWSDGGVIVPYNLYKMYGDISIIEEHYESMKKFMSFMATRGNAGGLPIWGDWLGYEKNDDEMKELIGVVYYAWDGLMMSEMAKLLGKTTDAAMYEQVYEKQKKYFQQTYLNADGSLKRREQTVCLLALKVGLLPDETSRQKAKTTLLNNIKGKTNKLQTGFIGTSIIMQTLSEIGASDMAYKLLLQRDEPSWLYCIDQGATTIWEKWNSYTKENGFESSKSSFNHYSYGAVAEWMYSYMAGIMCDLENPGFKHIQLQPMPDKKINSVECAFNSAYGMINSSWKYESNNHLTYNVSIPANTSATVILSLSSDNDEIGVNGSHLNEAEGVMSYEIKDKQAQIEIMSGNYEFYTLKQTGGSINEETKNKIIVFPNPTRDKLNIETDDVIQKIEIYNVFGVQVYSKENANPSVDLESFTGGVYFMNVKTNNIEEIIRVVKH